MTTTPTELARVDVAEAEPSLAEVGSTPSPTVGGESLVGLPGMAEGALAWAACFVLFHGLPMDWFRTRDEALAVEGNLPMVIVQLALMGLGIARVAGSFDWLLRVVRLDAALFGFVAMTMMSVFWSADPGETVRQSTIFLTVTLFAMYLVLRFSLPEILQIWALVFTASAIANLYFVLRLPVYGVSEAGQWDGVYTQKNALGWMALVGVPVLLSAGRIAPRFRLLYYPAAAALVALLLGSQSKTMLLASGGSIGLMAVYQLFRGRKTMRGVAYLGLLAAVGVTVTLTVTNIEALTELLDKDVSFTGRIPLWQLLVPIAAAEPLIGYGYKAVFTGYFGPVHEVWVLENWNPSHAHNELLNLWLQVGAVGMGLYLVSLGRALPRSVRTVAALPGAAGLWPLVFVSSAILVSITESGMSNSVAGWMMFVVAVLSASYHGANPDIPRIAQLRPS